MVGEVIFDSTMDKILVGLVGLKHNLLPARSSTGDHADRRNFITAKFKTNTNKSSAQR